MRGGESEIQALSLSLYIYIYIYAHIEQQQPADWMLFRDHPLALEPRRERQRGPCEMMIHTNRDVCAMT